jgi:hypothetical protein
MKLPASHVWITSNQILSIEPPFLTFSPFVTNNSKTVAKNREKKKKAKQKKEN